MRSRSRCCARRSSRRRCWFPVRFTSFAVILLLGGPRNATSKLKSTFRRSCSTCLWPGAVGRSDGLHHRAGFFKLAGRAVPLAPRLKGRAWLTRRRPRILVYTTVAVLVVLLVLPLVSLAVVRCCRWRSGGRRPVRLAGADSDLLLRVVYQPARFAVYVPPIAAARTHDLPAPAMLISVVLGFFAAYALARPAHQRWIEPALMLPLGTSAVTLGLGFILVFNRPPFDVRSFPALIPIAHSLVALPFVVRTIQPAIAAIPGPLRQAAAVLGASPLRVFWEIDVPIIARAALVGAVFSFTISLGEFGATTFWHAGYPTLPVAIYRFLSQPGAELRSGVGNVDPADAAHGGGITHGTAELPGQENFVMEIKYK